MSATAPTMTGASHASASGRGVTQTLKSILRPIARPMKRAAWRARIEISAASGTLRRMRRAQRGGVRILTYHGVCTAEAMRRPWVPAYFVTDELLDRHLTWLRQAGDIVSIDEAMSRLEDGNPRELAYVITFDDGHANNLRVAQPILQRHGVAGVYYITTGFCRDGGRIPTWILGRLLKSLVDDGRLTGITSEETRSIEAAAGWGAVAYPLADVLAPIWERVRSLVAREDVEAIRCLTESELSELAGTGATLGAHTVSHPFLSGVSPERGRLEIQESVSAIRHITGRNDVHFAYPNGRLADFTDDNVLALKAIGVRSSVTTVPGVNRPGAAFDRYRLHRLPVSRRYDRRDFLAMVSGLYDHDQRWQAP